MPPSLLVLVVFELFAFSAGAKIQPKSLLSIVDGQGFVAFLEQDSSFGNISNCWFKFQEDNNKTEVDLSSNKLIKTIRGEEVRRFSKTVCGIHVDKVKNASIGTWNLQSMNQSKVYSNDSVKISILTAPKVAFDTIVEKPLGKNTISCTKQDYTRVCRLINYLTGESWNQCELYTKINDGHKFECRTLSWGSMNESVEKITVNIAPNTQYSEGSVEETDDHYILRCSMKSTTVQSCLAEMPDRRTRLYLAEGLSNGRYSSYDTMSSKSKCALEIQKPLEQSENGLWKIIQHSDSSVLGTGCLFYVGASSKETIIKDELNRQQDEDNGSSGSKQDENQDENEDEDKESTTLLRRRRIELYSTESIISEITCTVPFVVDDCYLRDPKNTVHFPDSGRFQRSRALGICTFINVQSMPGIWSCGLRGSDYKDDVVQDIEVFIQSKLGQVVTGSVRIAQRESLELMCKSPFEEPISRCVYVSPTSQVHLVASTIGGTKMTGHIQYFGEGIERGFCGMRISSVIENDFGSWSCQFQTVNNGATVSNFTITVNEIAKSQMSWYGILGIALGAAVVAAMSIAAVIFGYKKLRQSRSSNADQVEAIGMSVRE